MMKKSKRLRLNSEPKPWNNHKKAEKEKVTIETVRKMALETIFETKNPRK